MPFFSSQTEAETFLLDGAEVDSFFSAASEAYPEGAAPVALYSTRLANPDYTGPLMRVRRSSDDAEVDVYPDASGLLSLTSPTVTAGGVNLGTWVGANNANLARWYEQMGSGNHIVIATPGLQPLVVNAGAVVLDEPGGRPALSCLNTSSMVVPSLTMAEVFVSSNLTTDSSWYLLDFRPDYSSYVYNGSTTVGLSVTSGGSSRSVGNISDGTRDVLRVKLNATTTCSPTIASRFSTSDYAAGTVSEFAFYATNQDANAAAIEADIAAFGGHAVSSPATNRVNPDITTWTDKGGSTTTTYESGSGDEAIYRLTMPNTSGTYLRSLLSPAATDGNTYEMRAEIRSHPNAVGEQTILFGVGGAPTAHTITTEWTEISRTAVFTTGISASAAFDNGDGATDVQIRKVRVWDPLEGSDPFSDTNQAPAVASPIANVTGTAGDGNVTVDLLAVFSDPDGDALTYTVQSGASASISSSTLTVSRAGVVSETVVVRATDPSGLFVEDSFTVNVSGANASPTVANAIPNVSGTVGDSAAQFNLNTVFNDPNGDSLAYTVQNGGSASIAGSTLTISHSSAVSETVTIRATDPGGLWVEDSFTVSVVAGNAAPTVSSPIPNVTGTAGDPVVQVDLTTIFSDSNGDSLTYTVQQGSSASIAGALLTITRLGVVSETVIIRATDPGSLFVEDSFTVNVTAEDTNVAPTVTSPLPDVTGQAGDPNLTTNLSTVFSDADGDPLTYTVQAGTSASIASGVLTVNRGSAVNEIVTIRATDPDGLWVQDSFTVVVTEPAPTPVGDMPVFVAYRIRRVSNNAILGENTVDPFTPVVLTNAPTGTYDVYAQAETAGGSSSTEIR